MRGEALYWNRVVVTSDDRTKCIEVGRCFVRYGDGSLSIVGRGLDGPTSLLYGRAELIVLDATRAVFRACWWSASVGSKTFDELVPVEVTCEF